MSAAAPAHRATEAGGNSVCRSTAAGGAAWVSDRADARQRRGDQRQNLVLAVGANGLEHDHLKARRAGAENRRAQPGAERRRQHDRRNTAPLQRHAEQGGVRRHAGIGQRQDAGFGPVGGNQARRDPLDVGIV